MSKHPLKDETERASLLCSPPPQRTCITPSGPRPEYWRRHTHSGTFHLQLWWVLYVPALPIVTSSEFFSQPKCPMAHLPQASTPASELSASCTSNPTTVLKTNTHLHHLHYLIPRLAPPVLPTALFFLPALYHPRGTNSSASETYSGLEWLYLCLQTELNSP